MNEEVIAGKNPIIEAIKSQRTINKILLSNQLSGKVASEVTRLAKKQQIPVQTVPRQKLDQISDAKHQGMIAYVSSYAYATIDDILQVAKQKEELPFIMILDELEDPYNLGAILRTADATGVHGVIIPNRRSVSLTETVAKTSAGAIEHIPVARVTNIVRAINQLKEENVWVVGTDEAGEKDYRSLEGDMAIALVIGNEGRGISRLVRENCDWSVNLPMIGEIPSLNASVAASLLMYEVFRERHPVGEA